MTALKSHAASVSFTGSDHSIVTITPEKNTGLDAIYVIYDTKGVDITFTGDNAQPVTWYIYSALGGGYAEEVTTGVTQSGNVSTLSPVAPNYGYIIEQGTDRTYIWVTNYADYRLNVNSIILPTTTDCDKMTLPFDGTGEEMAYYTITGQRRTISRELQLSYLTLELQGLESATAQDTTTEEGDTDGEGDGEETEPQEETDPYANVRYEQVEKTVVIDDFKRENSIDAPLCNTSFTLTGDRFLKEWKEDFSIESDYFTTTATQCYTTARQLNKKKNSDAGLGGSAPAEIEFVAHITDAVIFREWQIATDADFTDLQYRFNSQEVTYTFKEAGTFYARFYGANDDASCECYGDTYTITIGNSRLDCPNAFTPKNQDGINDVWRVTSASLVEFECHIFNRYGIKMATLTDPSQGWDGRKGGKFVPDGVYFYVIKARGADGKTYNLKGDINIINFKEAPTPTTTDDVISTE